MNNKFSMMNLERTKLTIKNEPNINCDCIALYVQFDCEVNLCVNLVLITDELTSRDKVANDEEEIEKSTSLGWIPKDDPSFRI